MKVKRNIMINKAGGNSTGVNYKISLPAKMVKALRVTEEDREVVVELDRKAIYRGGEIGWRTELFILISKEDKK